MLPILRSFPWNLISSWELWSDYTLMMINKSLSQKGKVQYEWI